MRTLRVPLGTLGVRAWHLRLYLMITMSVHGMVLPAYVTSQPNFVVIIIENLKFGQILL